jgi:adenylate cyclase
VEAKRKLAAILSADVVGYSRLMGIDEEATVAALNENRAVFKDKIIAHQGRVVDTAGDSVLAVFDSVVESVRAALEIQETLAQRNEGLPDNKRMRFRIGVNLGDVIEQVDGTIYGDGVNVAARLEKIAEPGGVMLSESAQMHIEGMNSHVFADAGTHRFKNINRPIKAFGWKRGDTAEVLSRDRDSEDRKPTISIGMFEKSGGSDEVNALTDGVRDAVAATLTNQTGMVLLDDVARADYMVTAHIQGLGNRYRATVRVFDRRADEHFASERFDGEISDLFESQDELANQLYMSARFAIYDREGRKPDERPFAEQGSQALLSQAGYLLFSSDKTKWLRAEEMLSIVLEREPNDDMALAMIAASQLAELLCGYRDITPEDRQAIIDRARRATRINGNSEFARFVLCAYYLYCDQDFDAAEREAKRALEINPYYSVATFSLGWTNIFRGQAEEGIDLCRKAIDANPRAPINHRMMWVAATGYFVLEQYDAAVDWAKRSDQQEADVIPNLLLWITSATHAGKNSDASRVVKRLLSLHPDFDMAALRRWPFRDDAIWERFADGLREAGLPG